MLYVEEIYRLFDELKEKREEDPNYFTGILFGSSIDSSFGRLYFRTTIKYIGKFYTNYSHTYISYGICSGYCHEGNKLFDICKNTITEQVSDVKELIIYLKDNFPEVSIVADISHFGILKEFNDRIFREDIYITGKSIWEYKSPVVNEETEKKYDKLKEDYVRLSTRYLEIKERINKIRKERIKKEMEEKEIRFKMIEIEEKALEEMYPASDEADEEIKKLGRKIKNLN